MVNNINVGKVYNMKDVLIGKGFIDTEKNTDVFDEFILILLYISEYVQN